MPILQLELNLWQQLAEAQQSPQAVDWQQLCLAFDEAIARTPVGVWQRFVSEKDTSPRKLY
jgi:hypothetical protein